MKVREISGAKNQMRFCTQCGASLDPDEQFCWQCGIRQADQVPVPAQSPPPPPTSSFTPYTVSAPAPVPPASGIVLTPQVIVGIVVAFIIIAAVLFFVLPPRSPASVSPETSGSTGNDPGLPGTGPQQVPSAPATGSTREGITRTQVTTTTSGCPQGIVLCSCLCRDVSTDEQNCGGCGSTCTANQVCSSGECTTVQGYSVSASLTTLTETTYLPATTTPLPTTAGCAAGKTLCYGSCVDLLTNTGNCGQCNHKCIEGEKCSGGQCVFSYCLKPLTLCNGICKNLNSDMNNCGGCSKVCPSSVSHGTVSCQNGVCKVTCEKDYGNCDGNIVNGCESYLRFDANNCGACGVKCPSGYVCDADTSGCHPRIIK
jgi:Stigma-specific protein, Stig1